VPSMGVCVGKGEGSVFLWGNGFTDHPWHRSECILHRLGLFRSTCSNYLECMTLGCLGMLIPQHVYVSRVGEDLIVIDIKRNVSSYLRC
jgi:hypothetical protein